MTAGPRLAVVTPLFDARRYIAETVNSILPQLAPGDEYVVVDDGSRDGSGDAVRDTLARAPGPIAAQVRLIAQQNQGEAAAVNRGVAEVEADIVGIVNADDPILNGLLDEVRAAFATRPELAAVYPDWLKIDAEGQRIAEIRTYDFDFRVLLAQHMCIPGPGAFFRRSALQGEPVRDALAYGISDYDFWLRLGRRGAIIRRIPAVLATWRLHAQGTTATSQNGRLAATKIAVIKRFLDLPDLSDEIRALRRQALSAAFNQAALVALRGRGVPARRYVIASYATMLCWPQDVLWHQRRSVPHLAYAAAQPVSGLLHAALTPLLPARYRRRAVLNQTFRTDVPPSR